MQPLRLSNLIDSDPFYLGLPEPTQTPRRVLILEDDPTQKMIIKSLLMKTAPDLKIHWMTFAEEALAALSEASENSEECPYVLVIADIFLDGPTDGLEFWRQARDLYEDLPILVTSGINPEDLWRRKEVRGEAPTFLAKPFHRRDFRDLIKILLSLNPEME